MNIREDQDRVRVSIPGMQDKEVFVPLSVVGVMFRKVARAGDL